MTIINFVTIGYLNFMNEILLLRDDSKRYCFYRITKYRSNWGVCSYSGSFDSDNNIPRRGLLNASLFKTCEEATHKMECLLSQASSRNFKEFKDINQELYQRYFTSTRDLEILATKKISTKSNMSYSKNIIANPEPQKFTLLPLPAHFIDVYSCENNITSSKKYNTQYYQKIWQEFGPEIQLCWIETHPKKSIDS